MRHRSMVTTGLQLGAGALACAGAAYAAHTAFTWLRYGRQGPTGPDERDTLLDRFMPQYEVVDRLHAKVRAPADVTLEAAEQQDLMDAPGVSAIFRLRQLAMGSGLETRTLPAPLVEQMKALGWVELARVPGREVVFGAVTQPWLGDVVFRSIAPSEFAAFDEPGYVKIAWTLRADPLPGNVTLFRTETRAIATDDDSRARFRTYWSMVAPGVWLIRRLSVAPMKRRAERRVAVAAA